MAREEIIRDKILLGFEVDSGKPVYLPLHHLAIFGMTQKSGKTTALEAIILRAGLKAIAFITKRGEGGFTKYNLVTPYYKPRSDWQYVESLVNVALGEKVKYEPGMRSAIMKVCRGRKDLKQIQLVARELAKTDKSAFMRSVYERLDEYFDIVIPELDKWTFTEKLDLQEGVNVMDLIGMRLETQHLVIASTIEYAFANLDHVIVIVPEAWESIPQGKMTPVKWVAQQFVRKGAALGNYLFLDSQDIGGIDKTPLRQVDNWLMGRMKEAHEVERILKQLLGAKVPAEEIQTLALGHFYAAIGNDVKKLYVLPLGVPEQVGVDVATGKRTPESVHDEFMSKIKVTEDESLYKEENDRLRAEIKFVNQEWDKDKKRKQELETQIEKPPSTESVKRIEFLEAVKKDLQKRLDEIGEQLKLYDELKSVLRRMFPRGIPENPFLVPGSNPGSAVGLQKVMTVVDLPSAEKLLTIDTENMRGKILSVAKKGKLDQWRRLDEIVKAIQDEHWNATSQEVNNALNDLEKQDLIAKKHTDRNYYCLGQGVRFQEVV